MKIGIIKGLSIVLLLTLLCGCGMETGNPPVSSSSSGVSASSEDGSSSLSAPHSSESSAASSAPEKEILLWPQERMGDLPDPGGKVLSVNENENGVQVAVEGIHPQDAQDYLENLRELGYNNQAEGEDGQGGLMCSAVKDGHTVVFLYSLEDPDSDTGLCQISYKK